MKNIFRHACCAVLAFSLSAWTVCGFAQPARAWGAQGHQYVGNLGLALLNPVAKARVAKLLGPNINLGQAAVWADCLRSVDGTPPNLRFTMDQYTPQVCTSFDDGGAEEERMIDYARRNWTNCEYSGHFTKCHQAYHFADVNVHNRQNYDVAYFGAGKQDVVQAIKAAITVLRCPTGQTCPTNAPFNIKDKREALFLLAHFLGDIHQPLHVGAIYLDANENEGGDDGRETRGGNLLLLAPGKTSDNLHHSWDTILASLKTAPSATAIAAACKLAPNPDPALQQPESWASETVVAARAAYSGMRYSTDTKLQGYWDIDFTDPGYAAARRTVQGRQLVVAGARLAATLNAIWPSRVKSKACKSS
jgi:hypothetical protein